MGLAVEGRVKLTGLHLLLTYGCTYECDHCFVWSSPWRSETMTLERVEHVLQQTRALSTVEWFYFEGGEPFLYHALLRWGVRRAAEMGFKVGVVSNAYWATDARDAEEWLRDFPGRVQDLSLSCDGYHGDPDQEGRVEVARTAAQRMGIPVDVIRITEPARRGVPRPVGKLPPGESPLMFRGRAAERLAERVPHVPGESLDHCPYEDLREPGRVHVDPLGLVHLCQGICLGNVFRTPLAAIVAGYEPARHPIAGPLLRGGPAELARHHGMPPDRRWADACHMCYATRKALRPLYPDILQPDLIYGDDAAR
ncbi:MAG: radical SAM protein [Candidatus Eisenbacteria bacterium]